MKTDISYGIVPLRRQSSGDWEVLLVLHQKGFWAFPKGHAELNESPEETASRELHEETGLKVVQFLALKPFSEHYVFHFQGEPIHKTVIYFAALVEGSIHVQIEEIQDCQWFSFQGAEQQITFKESKSVLKSIINSLI